MTVIQMDLGPVLAKLDEIQRQIDAIAKPTGPDTLTVDQVAEIKGRSAETIRRWARNGELKCVPGVRPYRFKADEINRAS